MNKPVFIFAFTSFFREPYLLATFCKIYFSNFALKIQSAWRLKTVHMTQQLQSVVHGFT